MKRKIILLVAIVAVVVLFFALGLHRYVNLEFFQAQRAVLVGFYDDHPVLTIVVFLVGYIAMAGLSIPGATIVTLAAGAVFGLPLGLVLVSFASSIGATLACLLARYLFRDAVQNRFAKFLKPINQGVERDGAFYLFAMRLVPAIPFFVINLVMGLTPIRLWTFYWVSQLGMLAGTAVYVNAGKEDRPTGVPLGHRLADAHRLVRPPRGLPAGRQEGARPHLQALQEGRSGWCRRMTSGWPHRV